MTVEYASKFAGKVDEKLTQEAITTPAVNNNYDFTGVETVTVYSVGTVALNDYKLTGNERYGTASELDNAKQDLKMKKDRSFTFSIDRKSADDTNGAMDVGNALGRQIREQVVPEVDKHRLATIVAGAGKTVTGAIAKNEAYEKVLDGQVALREAKAPRTGNVIYVSTEFFKKLKLDDNFIKASELGQQVLMTGQLGMVDGLPVILATADVLPEKVDFVITNPNATVSPVKLESYKVHEDPVGISGYLVEGRIRYDAFVLTNQAKNIYVHKGV